MKRTFSSTPLSPRGLCYGILMASVIARNSICLADEFPEPPPQIKTYDLIVSSAAEPKPALKYRLLPDLNECVPGNAASHYVRALLLFAPTDHGPKEQKHFESEWYGKPYDQLPVDEVREWLNAQKQVIDVLMMASRCEGCDWGFRFQDLRGRAVIEFPMPEIQHMRQMARILNLKVAIEIGEKKFDEALETLKIQYCLARDLGKVPSLIANLVGVAVQAIANDSLIDLMSSEGSPNVYWALRDLPSPLINLRSAVRLEASMVPRLFPFLEDAEKSMRTSEEWRRLLFDSYAWVESEFGSKTVDEAKVQSMFDSLMTRSYPIAKRELIASGYDAENVDRMPVGQVVAIYVGKCHREMMDQVVKWMSVPYAEGHVRLKSLTEELILKGYVKRGPDSFADRDPLLFNSQLSFSFEQFNEAANRQPRLLAAMSVVEAIRLHASSHSGMLPKDLNEITEVTVPDDPATGKPFLYRIVDGQAELLGPPTMPGVENSGRRFRLKLR